MLRLIAKCLKIFVAAVLVIPAAACGSSNAVDYTGTYELTAEDTGTGFKDPDWPGFLELKNGGKGTLSIDAFELTLTDWKIDGDTFISSYRQFGETYDFNGTYQDGVIKASNDNGSYQFTREGTASSSEKKNESQNPEGTYYPYAADVYGIMMSYNDLLDADMVENVYIKINKDGRSGEMSMDEEGGMPMSIDLEKGIMTFEDNTVIGIEQQEDGSLKVDMTYGEDETEGSLFMFLAKEGNALDKAREDSLKNSTFGQLNDSMTADEEEDSVRDWWNGEWYGWWIIRTAYGNAEEYEGYWWDACALIDINEDYTGKVILWDEESSMEEPLGEVEVTLSEYGVGEHGTLYSESGWFSDHQIEHADWISDPAVDVDKDNMILLEGTADWGSGSYTYQINLRKWGTYWDDMEEKDLPYYYSSWYVPLIEEGKSMPYEINNAEDAPAHTEDAPAVETVSTAVSSSNEGTTDKQAIIDAYNRITGMDSLSGITYDDVKDIIGTDGKLDEKQSTDQKHYYHWYGEGTNVILTTMFKDIEGNGTYLLMSIAISGDYK